MSMNPEPPFFINVYGGLGFQPHYISLILATQRLLGDQVEFVGMQDYVRAQLS